MFSDTFAGIAPASVPGLRRRPAGRRSCRDRGAAGALSGHHAGRGGGGHGPARGDGAGVLAAGPFTGSSRDSRGPVVPSNRCLQVTRSSAWDSASPTTGGPPRRSLKEIEAAGFSFVQVPSPPPSVLDPPPRRPPPRGRPVGCAGNRGASHRAPRPRFGARRNEAGRPGASRGCSRYAAEVGASHVVYHAANLPDEPASEDGRLAETRSLASLAGGAERLGVIIALENLAPVFPSPDALSFTPMILRTMAKRISSPAVGLCVDVGHANVVAGLRRTDPLELIEPVLDRTVMFHLHDNLGGRHGDPGAAGDRPAAARPPPPARAGAPCHGSASPRCWRGRTERRSCWRCILRAPRPPACSRRRWPPSPHLPSPPLPSGGQAAPPRARGEARAVI